MLASKICNFLHLHPQKIQTLCFTGASACQGVIDHYNEWSHSTFIQFRAVQYNKTKSKVFSLERLYKVCIKKKISKKIEGPKTILCQKLIFKKKFGSEKFWSEKKFCLKKFWFKIFLEPIKFLV